MEYLMTYGWALLVIVIVIAVLMFIRPFGAPESCVFQQPGFSCEGHRLVGDQLYASVVNGQQKSIEQVSVACARGTNEPDSYTDISGTFPHGQAIPVQVTCPTTVGEDFSGRLYVLYHYNDDASGVPAKRSVANVIGPVQPAS